MQYRPKRPIFGLLKTIKKRSKKDEPCFSPKSTHLIWRVLEGFSQILGELVPRNGPKTGPKMGLKWPFLHPVFSSSRTIFPGIWDLLYCLGRKPLWQIDGRRPFLVRTSQKCPKWPKWTKTRIRGIELPDFDHF